MLPAWAAGGGSRNGRAERPHAKAAKVAKEGAEDEHENEEEDERGVQESVSAVGV